MSLTTSLRLACLLLALAAPGARPAGAQIAPPPKGPLKVGVVLSGGGARGIAHVGVLQWFEEHRIPVDYLTGTSMGGLIGGMYSLGISPAELRVLLKELNWEEIFDARPTYDELSFRRKEDRRTFQTDFEFGLRNGVSLPTGLSSGHYIGLVIDRLTLPYSEITSFDELPIPFRCMATDFIKAEPIVLAGGPISTALRATMSIPGVFPPVERDGRVLVDGALLNNIPTNVMRELRPDVVIAVDIGTRLGDMVAVASLSGILQQAVTVMTIDNDRRNLRLADVIIAPELGELSTLDFSAVDRTADLGYQAAAQKAAILDKFALDEAAWEEHLARRRARRRTAVPVPDAVLITGVDDRGREALGDRFTAYVGRPLDTARLEKDLNKVVGQGRYESIDYRFQPAGEGPDEDVLGIQIREKTYGPPTANFGLEIDGSEVNDINFTIGARVTLFDLGGYGSEWRNDVRVGFRTQLLSEYFRPLGRRLGGGYFVAPRGFYRRDRTNVFVNGVREAEYEVSQAGVGIDFGYLTRRSEWRAGYQITRQDARVRIGDPVFPTLAGPVSLARTRWAFDGQDSATVPTRGTRLAAEMRYYFNSPEKTGGFPQAEVTASTFKRLGERGSAFAAGLFGTTFNRDAAPAQQFTLGGPFRLGAYDRDEFRGNHYILAALGYLHPISELPPLLGGRINAIGWLDAGGAFRDFGDMQLRGEVNLGLVLDTRLGPFSLIGSYGEGGRAKIYFSFGRFF